MGSLLAISTVKWSMAAKVTLLAIASAALLAVIIMIIVLLCTRRQNNVLLFSPKRKINTFSRETSYLPVRESYSAAVRVEPAAPPKEKKQKRVKREKPTPSAKEKTRPVVQSAPPVVVVKTQPEKSAKSEKSVKEKKQPEKPVQPAPSVKEEKRTVSPVKPAEFGEGRFAVSVSTVSARGRFATLGRPAVAPEGRFATIRSGASQPKTASVPVTCYISGKQVPIGMPAYTPTLTAAPTVCCDKLSLRLYEAVRSEILSFADVRPYRENGVERFVCGRRTFAVLTIYQNAVCLYLPPIVKPNEKFGLRLLPPQSVCGIFAETPLFLFVKDERRMEFAKDLIRLTANKYGVRSA